MRQREKIDWSDCPLVEAKPNVLGGSPVLLGTRMPADAIVDNFEYGVSIDEISEQFGVPPDSVRAVVTYASSQHDRRKRS